jgi:hypothetical protein
VKARPDGYTLLLVGAVNTINATLYERLNFVFVRDIAPVASMVRAPSKTGPAGASIGDELGSGMHRKRWMYHHDQR